MMARHIASFFHVWASQYIADLTFCYGTEPLSGATHGGNEVVPTIAIIVITSHPSKLNM